MPVCTRKNCTEPPVDGYRICQKHLDIVLAGRAKRDAKSAAPVPAPAPDPHECDDCEKEPYCNGTGCIMPTEEEKQAAADARIREANAGLDFEPITPDDGVDVNAHGYCSFTAELVSAVPDYRMELIETLAELAMWQLEPNDSPEAIATLARIQAVARA